ncbi:PH domain-containing protein, partial [Streptomyces sp. SID14478]|nr:PH domain-containing protein [Streptomyces sp. SID14478]
APPAAPTADQSMQELRELREARARANTSQGEPSVRWAYEIIAPAVVGALLLIVLIAVG